MKTEIRTVIFGRYGKVSALVEEHGADMTIRRPSGYSHSIASPIRSFEGGYDDYNGTMATATVHAHVAGPMRRFSPAPGEWCTGVAV